MFGGYSLGETSGPETSTSKNTTTTSAGFGFSQPQQNTSIFSTAQPGASQASLFGQPSTSAFGAAKPSSFGFGQIAPQPTTSLFGQAQPTSTFGFGSFGQANQTTYAFASATTAFGQPTTSAGNAHDTVLVKYQPTIGTDTLMKGGFQYNVKTKLHCITAMNECDSKSLEELRMENYFANQKKTPKGISPGCGQSSKSAITFAAETQSRNIFHSKPICTSFLANQDQKNQSKIISPCFGKSRDCNASPQSSAFNASLTGSKSIFGHCSPTFKCPDKQNSVFSCPLEKPMFSAVNQDQKNQPKITIPSEKSKDYNASPQSSIFAPNLASLSSSKSIFGTPKPEKTDVHCLPTFKGPEKQNSVFSCPPEKPMFNAVRPSVKNNSVFSIPPNDKMETGREKLIVHQPKTPNFYFEKIDDWNTSSQNTAVKDSDVGNKPLFEPPSSHCLTKFSTNGFSGFKTQSTKPKFETSIVGGNTTYGVSSQETTTCNNQRIPSKVIFAVADNSIFKQSKCSDESKTSCNAAARETTIKSSGLDSQHSDSIKLQKPLFEVKPKGMIDSTPNLSLDEGTPSQSDKDVTPVFANIRRRQRSKSFSESISQEDRNEDAGCRELWLLTNDPMSDPLTDNNLALVPYKNSINKTARRSSASSRWYMTQHVLLPLCIGLIVSVFLNLYFLISK